MEMMMRMMKRTMGMMITIWDDYNVDSDDDHDRDDDDAD